MTTTPQPRRRRERRRLATGIYADSYGISAIVIVGKRRDERRFRFETPIADMQSWRLTRQAELRHLAPPQEHRAAAVLPDDPADELPLALAFVRLLIRITARQIRKEAAERGAR